MIALGLGKKVLISDPLAQVSDPLFHIASRVVELGLLDAWQAALAFTFQIYFDFSGYTDMALGIALLFGIVLPQNFNAPYRATTLQDFWRRWHMTLSRFLRDYLYIPLGGNRNGIAIKLFALCLTMLLGGLWHGAGLNFLVWGGLHGLSLAFIALWSIGRIPLPSSLGWMLTFLFIVFTWISFRATDISSAILIWKGMLGFHEQISHRFSTNSYWSLIGFAFFLSTVGPTSWSVSNMVGSRTWAAIPVGCILLIALLRLGGNSAQQFIYFQF